MPSSSLSTSRESNSVSNGIIPMMAGSLLSIYDWIHCNPSYRSCFSSSPLLQTLLSFASSMVPDVHSLYQACYCKMLFTIFLLLTEDSNAASILHDPEKGSSIPSLFEKVIFLPSV